MARPLIHFAHVSYTHLHCEIAEPSIFTYMGSSEARLLMAHILRSIRTSLSCVAGALIRRGLLLKWSLGLKEIHHEFCIESISICC